MKILIVDDNKDTKFYEFAGEADEQITVIHNGYDALKYLADNAGEIDAVLLDLSMSPLDGLTLAEEIRQNEQMTPHRRTARLAFHTGAEIDDVVKDLARAQNVEQIFMKPIDPIELLARVRNWMRTKPPQTEKDYDQS